MAKTKTQYFGTRGQLPDGKVESLMTEGELKEALQQAWWRIAHTFAKARSAPGRRATPCYIAGVDRRLSSVAQHIIEGMSVAAKEEIFAARDLPEGYERFLKGSPTEVAEKVVRELIMRELIDLRNRREIYFMEAQGEWRILPSALTEYYRLVRQVVPDPSGRADYRRNSSGPKIARRRPKAVRNEIIATAS